MPPRPASPALLCLLFAFCATGALHASAAGFGLKDVDALAKQRAAAAFTNPDANLPPELQRLDHDRYQAIAFKPDTALWHGAKPPLPFTLAFFPQGWAFDRPVGLHEITPRGVHDLAFDPAQFDFGAAKVDPSAIQGLGYAGFRATTALNLPGQSDEFVSFLGASYFRAIGKGQLYGLSARGLAIDTAQASGEEFPRFVEFWIERPKPNAGQLVVYGLLDSPRASGAYRFAIQPGVDTVVEVEARIYLRDKVDKLGLAPLTSMYLRGANQRTPSGEDYRPEVHDSDGLSVQSDGGEWIWRPLLNPKRLLVTSFAQTHPRGFGLMQRARGFDRYEDLQTRYDLHPSAWVEPIGDWGAGRVELVMIPAQDETNDNIVAYWVPATTPALQQPLALKYRVHWQKDQETQPPFARVVQTRQGTRSARNDEHSIGFAIDFAGPLDGDGDGEVEAVVGADANAQALQHSLKPSADGAGWRLSLRLKRNDDAKPVELRAYLKRGAAVSETWSYVLPPN
ncbi:glucan biosynthesis protein G [Dokdonella sp.]|uniref:glucan biosynthesis protein G n=1 Tax=Dokdonella sp. TaxID=2291710 RepID=UPI001B1DB758|nr:glucan biosynthesis protein G [Dokdonella sp.]MBO9664445.1 glucan biosynthesis protein G [Dokdonella sp.]